MRALSRSAGVYLLVLCLSSAAAGAGAIEVRLREKDGPYLINIAVGLMRLADASEAPRSPSPRAAQPQARTDLNGKAVFEGLPPGTYRIAIGGVPAPLVGPGEYPFDSHPVATLEKENDRVSVEIEVPRGTEVTVEIVSDAQRRPRGRLLFREIHRGKEYYSGSLDGILHEEILVPGVWEVSYENQSGQLLVGLEQDGVPFPGDRLVLDLPESRRETFLTFRFTAPCRLTGQLRYEGNDVGGVEILATLIEPGPWIDAARERGSVVDHVTAGPRRGSWDYTLELPEGVWEVRPVGEVLISSEPEYRRVSLENGEEARADFEVLRKEDEKGATLEIQTLAPSGGRLNGVVVEAWSTGPGPGGDDEPAATAESQFEGRTWLSGLESGDYRVVAAHPSYHEAEIRVEDFNSEGRRRREKISLGLGGVIRVRARDEAGRPLPGATLHVERLSEPPPSLLSSEKVREAKRARTAVTDTTGISHLTGLEDGEYRFRAELADADAVTGFALVSLPGESKEEELELTLDEDSRQDVEIGVRPAGSLAGRLVCRDRGALPTTAAFRVCSPDEDESEEERTVLALDDVVLRGGLRDGFRVGPLEEGAYHLAVRPAGHSLWTFAPGTGDPERASLLQATPREELDLGTVEVYCGPVIVLTEERDPEDEGPRLDLRRATVRSDLLVETEPGSEEPVRPERRASAETILLLDLPPGKARLDLEIDHPHLLAPLPRRATHELVLERGRGVGVTLPPGALGGTIRVSGPGAAVQARSESGEMVAASLLEGRAELVHLAPGPWSVATCKDPECEVLLREWPEVHVAPCTDTELSRAEGRPMDTDL